MKKVRDALLGHDKCRVRELQHMLGFTHTGLIGKTYYLVTSYYSDFPPESWNALNNKYANKHFYYGYRSMTILYLTYNFISSGGMFVRAALTALDWNSNLNREQVSLFFIFLRLISIVARLVPRLGN